VERVTGFLVGEFAGAGPVLVLVDAATAVARHEITRNNGQLDKDDDNHDNNQEYAKHDETRESGGLLLIHILFFRK